jgi:hypothetical protein
MEQKKDEAEMITSDGRMPYGTGLQTRTKFAPIFFISNS